MSIRLYNSSGGYIDLESGGTSAAANVFTLPAETGTILTSATTSGINASALSAGTLPGARLPAGSVLQVVNTHLDAAAVTSASATFTDTGLSASITPSSATSKILVFFSHNGCGKENGNTFLQIRLLRESTTIANVERQAGYTGTTAANWFGGISFSYLDSPATTSSTTYKTQFANQAAVGTVFVNTNQGGANTIATMILMEIAA